MKVSFYPDEMPLPVELEVAKSNKLALRNMHKMPAVKIDKMIS